MKAAWMKRRDRGQRGLVTALVGIGVTGIALVAATPAGATFQVARSWGTNLQRPTDVAVNRATGNVYVTDIERNLIDEFTPTGTLVRDWSPQAVDRLSHPFLESLAIAPNGDVVVSDASNVQMFDSAGHFKRMWGVGEAGSGIAVDKDGYVYVAGGSHVTIFTSQGHEVQAFNVPTNQINGFDSPRGVAVQYAPDTGESYLYIADANSGSVRVFSGLAPLFGDNPAGSWRIASPGGRAPAGDVDIAPDGDVLNIAGDSIQRHAGQPANKPFDSLGRISGGLSDPGGIDTDASGDVYVADERYNKIVELKPVSPDTTLCARPPALKALQVPQCGANVSVPWQRSGTMRVGFFTSDPKAKFQCRIDGGRWRGCHRNVKYVGFDVGNHTIEVRAIDSAGLIDPSPAKLSWTIDREPPKVTPLSAVFGLTDKDGGPLQVSSTSLPIQLIWIATDDSLSPLGFVLQQRTQSYGNLSDWTTRAKGRRYGVAIINIGISPKTSIAHQFRVQVNDIARNRKLVTGSTFKPQVIDEDALNYTGNWATNVSTDPQESYGPTTHSTGHAGDTAQFVFTGTSVALIGPRDPGLGTADVCVDPGKPQASCSTVGPTSTHVPRAIQFARNNLTNATHVLQVTDNGGSVVVDAIAVLTPA